MDILHTVLSGFVQGLTEFLPVSSSGHLVLFSSLYKVLTGVEYVNVGQEEIFTDIILHVGTLVAVLYYFRKDIVNICKSFFNALKTRKFDTFESKLPGYLVLGTIFTVFIAFPLNELCEKFVASPVITGIFLVITGCVLMSSERFSQNREKSDKITLKQAVLIGVAQGIAAIPGLSRSGMTIATGLFSGLDRLTAARYSFLLSIFIILGASVFYPFLKFEPEQFAVLSWNSIIAGFLTSMITGYFCIKYFLKFLAKYSMKIFAYYCWIIGICAIIGFGVIM